MRTIPKNHTKKIAAIRAKVTTCTVYALADGFEGRDVPVDTAFHQLGQFSFAKLVDMGDGTYKVRVHSNLWYEIR